jgi:pimeloyl-ACP methyl ester carboxylesterase
MKRFFLVFCCLACLSSMAWAQPVTNPGIAEFDLNLSRIDIRAGSTVDMHAKIFENTSGYCYPSLGNTILAIPGWTETANTWKLLARTLFNNQTIVWDGALITGNICRIIALDMPGSGGSSLPTGSLVFGDLTLQDYVTAILGSMDRLRTINVKAGIIMAHSQGGLLVQMMQETLLADGTSLRRAYGIRSAVLLASAPPQGFPWRFFDNINPDTLAGYVENDPANGSYLVVPDDDWIAFLFLGIDGQLYPGAPTPQLINDLGYKSPAPLAASLELANVAPFVRPAVKGGIFRPANGTILQMAAYEDDPIVRPEESLALYAYLTYDTKSARHKVVDKIFNGVHGLHIADPGMLLVAISGGISIPLTTW